MKNLVLSFTKQLTEAVQIGENAKLNPVQNEIRQIVITGLGGSGIGGTIVSDLVAGECTVPIIVNKDYHLPLFVNKHTLVIVSSYSGNTEETLSAMQLAIEKNAMVVCISSGGRVVELAKEHSLGHILIPGGMPPRSCLAYSFTQLFFVLSFYKFISNNFKSQLLEAIHLLDQEEKNIQLLASGIASKLSGKLPVIYSASGFEGVSFRLRQQLNENAKSLCWHHVVPEMNHNELVGWAQNAEHLAVIILRTPFDYERTVARIEINKTIISKKCNTVIELHSKGTSRISAALYLIHVCDWVSVFLAEHYKVDVNEVKVIDFLKSELSKM